MNLDLEVLPEYARKHATRWLKRLEDFGETKPSIEDFNDVKDWLFSLPEDAPKMVNKLARLNWQSAMEHQRKWHEALAKRSEKMKTFKGNPDDVEVISVDGNMRWVRLLTSESLDFEGDAMGHCIGKGSYDESKNHFYSLRDSNNMPHCTIEYNPGTKEVKQVQGKGNKDIIEKYHQRVLSFINGHLDFENVRNPNKLGCVFVSINKENKKLHTYKDFLYTVRSGDYVDGSLVLQGYKKSIALPGNLTVNGSLNFFGCTGFTNLPDDFTVNGGLNLSRCTSLTSIPDNLTVNGNLDLRGCTGLTSLPDNLAVNGFLDLRGCTGLTSIPDNLTVNGALYLSGCTGLTSIPDNLGSNGCLCLDGCTGLTSIPDNLKVEGGIWLPSGKFVKNVKEANEWFAEKFPEQNRNKKSFPDNTASIQ